MSEPPEKEQEEDALIQAILGAGTRRSSAGAGVPTPNPVTVAPVLDKAKILELCGEIQYCIAKGLLERTEFGIASMEIFAFIQSNPDGINNFKAELVKKYHADLNVGDIFWSYNEPASEPTTRVVSSRFERYSRWSLVGGDDEWPCQFTVKTLLLEWFKLREAELSNDGVLKLDFFPDPYGHKLELVRPLTGLTAFAREMLIQKYARQERDIQIISDLREAPAQGAKILWRGTYREGLENPVLSQCTFMNIPDQNRRQEA